jgi:hypothetical protein
MAVNPIQERVQQEVLLESANHLEDIYLAENQI